MRAKLTKRIVEGIPLSDSPVVAWDSQVPGFGVKVNPSGRRSYFLYYRTRFGQQRRPTIGVHGAITADEARAIALRWLADVAKGRDVSADRISDRRAQTISQLADRYLSDYAEQHKKSTSLSADRAILTNHVLPHLGGRKVQEVQRGDVEACIVSVRQGSTARRLPASRKRGRRVVTGGPIIANRTLALLSKMFACAIGWGLLDKNPAKGVKKYRETPRRRFLDLDEIGRLLATLEDVDRAEPENLYLTVLFRFLLFTGMRSGEVRNLKWSEVDVARKCLQLQDSKTGPRIIPLSGQAWSLLDQLPRGTAHDLVFRSFHRGSPLALNRPWHRFRDLARISADATVHTLRHTFASWSVMDGRSLAQVGAVLGHRSAQTTLRYAEHRLEAVREYSQSTGALFVARKSVGEPNGLTTSPVAPGVRPSFTKKVAQPSRLPPPKR